MIAAAEAYLRMVNDKTKIVPGHGPLADKAKLIEYRAMLITARDRMAKLIKDGKSLEECVRAKPTADFDAKWANGPVRPDQLVEELYADLKPKLR